MSGCIGEQVLAVQIITGIGVWHRRLCKWDLYTMHGCTIIHISRLNTTTMSSSLMVKQYHLRITVL